MYEPSKIFTAPEPQVVTEPWRKALLDAAELIRTKGLWKSGGDYAKGQQCAANAIGAFAGYNYGEAHRRLGRYLGFGADVTKIFDWNDAPERTAAEVISALQGAARS